MSMAVRNPVASSAGASAAAPVRPAEQREHGHGEEAGRPGHGVVDRRGDAGVLGRRGAHRGRGERGDGRRPGRAEEEDGGEHLGPVAPRVGGPGEQGEPGAHDERPDAHLQAGPDARRELRRTAPRRRSMITVTGRRARPDVERAVVRHDLELDREQEQRAAERAVDDEGDARWRR